MAFSCRGIASYVVLIATMQSEVNNTRHAQSTNLSAHMEAIVTYYLPIRYVATQQSSELAGSQQYFATLMLINPLKKLMQLVKHNMI